jgi:hypothetical protein
MCLNFNFKLTVCHWPSVLQYALFIWTWAVFASGSALVEYSPHYAKVQGSNAAATADSENGKNVDCL